MRSTGNWLGKLQKKSFVLLKNEDHILPLEQQKKIAFIGPYVDNRNLFGAWSFIADAKDVMTLHEAVQKQYVSENSTFCQGSPMLGADVCLEGFGEQQQQSYTQEQEDHMLREAVQAAKEADIVVLAIGEDRLQSGEATSNANIRIPEVQEALLDRIAEVNQNIVVVLFSGRPLDIRAINKKAKAILQVWLPGTEGARAIADTLFGKYNPSGKTADEFSILCRTGTGTL